MTSHSISLTRISIKRGGGSKLAWFQCKQPCLSRIFYNQLLLFQITFFGPAQVRSIIFDVSSLTYFYFLLVFLERLRYDLFSNQICVNSRYTLSYAAKMPSSSYRRHGGTREGRPPQNSLCPQLLSPSFASRS